MHTNGQTRSDYKYIIDPKSYYNESSMFFLRFLSMPLLLSCRTRWENIKLNKTSIKLRKKWVKRYSSLAHYSSEKRFCVSDQQCLKESALKEALFLKTISI